jgi:Protein of unknown function (DUF3307)
MTAASIWLTKLILSHLITDFILQPESWVEERNNKHFASSKLYLHGLITGALVWIITGFQYWLVSAVIIVTHILIDGWKSYRKQTAIYFLIDQLFHLIVLTGCWYFTFITWNNVIVTWQQLSSNPAIWKKLTAFVFLTIPSGILIGQLTKQWRDKLPEAENLANADKWIGIVERIIILIFVLYSQYAAIGLLVAAKGIIRFNEKDRQEIKTEYLVIGTLMSIGFAIITGLVIQL